MQRVLIFGILLLLTSLVYSANHHKAEIEDNEFAEFEEFDEDEEGFPKEEESKVNAEVKTAASAPPTFDDEVQIEV